MSVQIEVWIDLTKSIDVERRVVVWFSLVAIDPQVHAGAKKRPQPVNQVKVLAKTNNADAVSKPEPIKLLASL
jgi:hypothetical protein